MNLKWWELFDDPVLQNLIARHAAADIVIVIVPLATRHDSVDSV